MLFSIIQVLLLKLNMEENKQYGREKEIKEGDRTNNISTKYRIIFHWIIVVLYLAMIYYFSSQDGTKSHKVSAGLLEHIKLLFVFIPEDIFEFFSGVDKNHEYILRKMAHFTEYLILALIVFKALRVSRVKVKRSFVFTSVFCLLYAVSDEVHQFFVPGRAFAVTDILIDTSGAVFGLIIAAFFNYIKKRRCNSE